MTTERRDRNPLWVISLFLSLTEATLGIAASQVDGWIQGLWAVFAVVFPVGVSIAFFVLLWQRPEALYSPGDYGGATVTEFAAAMRGGPLQAVETTLREAVTAAVATDVRREDPDASSVVDGIVAKATDAFRNRTVEVDVSAVNTSVGVRPITIFIDDETTVKDLTNQVYLALAPAVKPYRYAHDWVLVDSSTGKAYTDMGRSWAKERFGQLDDTRRLGEVGIEGGARLKAVRI